MVVPPHDDDGDKILDGDDLCPLIWDDGSNIDGDNLADACDPDIDGDGVDNDCDASPRGNTNPINDNDRDGDGWNNTCDNCPDIQNADQLDSDSNGIGDACDSDKKIKLTLTDPNEPSATYDTWLPKPF